MSTLMERVGRRAQEDPARVLPVLRALVGERSGTANVLRRVSPVASSRRADAVREFVEGSLTTDEVIGRLPGVSTRQAVHGLRKRGRLLGRTLGNATYFPAWQFAGSGVRDDLSEILRLLRRYTHDALAADRVMRVPREELGGRGILEALGHDEDRSSGWLLLDRLGDGF